MLSQALKLSEIDHGDVSQWDIPSVSASNASHAATSKAFADEYIVKYLKGATNIPVPENHSYKGVAFYRLQNGVVRIHIWPRGTWTEICMLTSSDSKVAKSGRNSFCLILTKTGRSDSYAKVSTGGIYFYGYGRDRNTLKNSSFAGCNNKNADYYGLYCGALIQTDSWKISDDYDWR